jgi:hypothetical protein
MTSEEQRLEESHQRTKHWKRWGPYLAERQWGTVREDYSPGGTAWEYFPHDMARSRAYRWGEDGIAGISDNHQRLCFAWAFWNGRDPILKERLFGLGGPQGNHGEDVKECYFYLDSTPTHSYMKYLYKYPQAAFPYEDLAAENRRRGRGAPEYELLDTGVFDEDRYWDILIEYAKAGVNDILIRATATNRGPEAAVLDLLPTLWFRNTWSWDVGAPRPTLSAWERAAVIEADHDALGMRWLVAEGSPELLFTDNDTNFERLWGAPNGSPYVKDGIDDHVVRGVPGRVNPARTGTKAALHYRVTLGPGESNVIKLRLANAPPLGNQLGGDFDALFARRLTEADQFYATVVPDGLSDDCKLVMRQALGGLLWSKQFYHYDVRRWLEGDPTQPPPPRERRRGRNHEWTHLYNSDVISMPDKWEYPWYAAWDLAFHCLPLALVDPDFAKEQLVLLLREWYMHPNGQIPAYEWAFGDVNPPVHAWATWRVFQIDRKQRGDSGDLAFLERVFHKLMLNFTWWVNRKDAEGRNVFQGGFLGLDNIGVFDRSSQLPTGGHIDQSDGTSWMAMYALNLMRIALELAQHNRVYEDIATKFFEHFLHIAEAMSHVGGEEDGGIGLWDDQDKFFYDVLHLPDGSTQPLKVRSMVGLIPLFAVETLEPDLLEKLPDFKRRLEWFLANRPKLAALVSHWNEEGRGHRRLLSLLRGHRMKRLLTRMLDETEFLSPYGVRALSRVHEHSPYVYRHDGMDLSVRYQPAESDSGLFGGNSNWRGPIWFPVNFLIIESLQKFHHYYGDDFRIECPTGSGNLVTLNEAANEIATRLTQLFLANGDGRRPVHGLNERTQADPNFRDYVLFYEYFHGDTGRGVGAAHQTGWTGLVAKLLMPRYAAEVRPCKAELQAPESANERPKVAATPKSRRPRDIRPTL